MVEGIPCLETAIIIWATVHGNFLQAGTCQERLALFYETAKDRQPNITFSLEKIREAYQQALDYYESGNSTK